MGKITTVNKNERFPVVHLDPYHPFIEYLLSARECTWPDGGPAIFTLSKGVE